MSASARPADATPSFVWEEPIHRRCHRRFLPFDYPAQAATHRSMSRILLLAGSFSHKLRHSKGFLVVLAAVRLLVRI
jgi:hypothetical protein